MSGIAAILATLASSAISYGLNRWSQKENRKYNEAQQQKAYDLSTPSNQVAELKKAGLNPNLVYGSITPASYSANQSSPLDSELDFLKPMVAKWNREEQKQQMEIRELEKQRFKLENTVLAATAAERINNVGLRNQSLQSGILQKQVVTELNRLKQRLTNKQYELVVQSIDEAASRIKLNNKRFDIMSIEEKAKQLEYNVNDTLKQHGLTLNDASLIRLLARYLLPSSKVIEGFVDDAYDYLTQ